MKSYKYHTSTGINMNGTAQTAVIIHQELAEYTNHVTQPSI